MNLSTSTIKRALFTAAAGLMVLAFQNCSKVNFTENQSNPMFSLASTDISSPVEDTPTSQMTDDLPRSGPLSDGSKKNVDVKSASLVECELIAPNQKIVLDSYLKKGSNTSHTRVCMSEYACLRLINSYSARRNCDLSQGPSSLASSEAQCTKIFPGSKGTCHNAQVVTDDKVASILALMEN